MKTYRNDELGFELEVPEKWTLPAFGAAHSAEGELIVFGCEFFEAFNLQIAPLRPEPSPAQRELEIQQYTQDNFYTAPQFGRVMIEGKEHVWARFYMGRGRWSKKYLVHREGVEYTFTATCYYENRLVEREKEWDAVVASFHYGLGRDPKTTNPLAIPAAPIILENLPPPIYPKTQTNQENEPTRQPFRPVQQPGMKTYRNEKHGFEIELPQEWAPAPAAVVQIAGVLAGPLPKGVNKDVFQYGCYDEALNFEIGPLFPEPLLEDTDREFSLYARVMGFKDLVFGRITVAGKEHVCAHYYIDDKMGKRWNKKYMIVFGGIEYTLTATCNDPQWFARRAQAWDAIIKTFHLLAPADESANATPQADRYREKRREVIDQRIEMRAITGNLYATAYEAVRMGQFKKARGLLEACLRDDPDHVLAHKELAMVLRKMNEPLAALFQRREVKRLAPDDLVNRAALVELLAGCGKRGEALREAREVLAFIPIHPVFQALEQKLVTFRFTDYRLLFFSSLLVLILLDIGLMMPANFAITNVWCMRVMMLMPVGGIIASGPWMGLRKWASVLIAAALYGFFFLKS